MPPDIFDIYDKDRMLTGKTVPRGTPLSDGEYRIAVQVWIQNHAGQWLISQRSENKSHPLKWEPTGGCVLAGENSLQAAVREVHEELGITLNPEDGILFAAFRSFQPCWENPGFLDIWVFQDDTPIESTVFQHSEVHAARWATRNEILGLIASDNFVPVKEYAYHTFLPDEGVSRNAVCIARIRYMESILDRVLASKSPDAMPRELSILESYYFGPLWMKDHETDEAGLLPADLKRGVLSEDAVYNLFTENTP